MPFIKNKLQSLMRGFRLVFLLTVAASAQTGETEVGGSVKDSAGGRIAQASVTLLNARQSVVAAAQTDAQGNFTLRGVAPGTYELLVTHHGFDSRRTRVQVPSPEAAKLEITLGAGRLTEEVTITADTGVVQSRDATSQQTTVFSERQLAERAPSVLAQVAEGEVGVQLQRTSPTIGAIFVRGLTGNKVLVYVDGVRYSTSAMRGGINTFFNLNDSSNLRALEIVRGPNSAQFGGDSIGGSVQLISQVPRFAQDKFELHGNFTTFYNSADQSFGGNQTLTFGWRDLSVLANVNARRANTIRPGGGIDTHAAVTRFLGIPSDVFGERMTDTAFTQYGGLFRMNYALTPKDQLTFHYQRGQQDGGKRYDQTLGGDGNLIADLRNLMLDFFYARYERLQAGPFDTVSVSYSYNAQREERVNQGGNGNPVGAITHQYERTLEQGVQFQATKQWDTRNSLVFGGEYYHDGVRAPAYTLNPVNSVATPSRPRVPDRARYHSGAGYVQDVWTAIPERLRLIVGARVSGSSYESRAENSPLVGGQRLWPDDSLSASSVTPRFGMVLTLTPGLNLSAQVSRGFRAPHITDLGTLGLTGNGFEIAAVDLSGSGATIGSTADRNAVSTGIPTRQLVPETSWSYEGGLHVRHGRVTADLNGFVNDIYDNVVLQSLILPQGAVGKTFGGQTITSQLANGVVFVPASTNPVLIRANFGDSRIYGIEQNLNVRISSSWTFSNTFTYLHAEDKLTKLPPTIEGGTPAPNGRMRLRYEPSGRHFWIEPSIYGADRQDRLSTLDLSDRRTGATRSRTDISNFFLRGATVRGLIGPGPDTRLGTADDILLRTGETLAQVQNRVLGVGVGSAPLFTYIPGFLTLDLRGGFRVGERHEVILHFENITDKNYRGISWGLDAPRRSLGFRYSYRF